MWGVLMSNPETVSALIAEYNAIRAASLSRDQNRNFLMQFEFVVLSAIIAGLPAILDRGFWLILPATSILLVSLAGTSLDQAALVWELALYESGVLRPRLISALGYSNSPGGVIGIWDWQNFHNRWDWKAGHSGESHKTPKSSAAVTRMRAIIKRLLSGGRLSVDAVMFAAAGGLLALFCVRHFAFATLFERIIFGMACGLFGWSFLGSLRYLRGRRKRRLKFHEEASGMHISDSFRDWPHIKY
jgi:hypothetical protein